MSKFEDKKKEIKTAATASSRKTFNEQSFNELGTALLNEPGFESKVSTTVDGKHVTKTTTPVKDFRKTAIGGILRSAGHDTAEQQKFVDEYQFPTLPLYGVVSEMIEANLDAGKSFILRPKEDFAATLTIESVPEEIKEVKSPLTGETFKKKYGAYRKLKVKSTCPAHLKEKM